MMEKRYIISSIILFLAITIFVFCSSDTAKIKRVSIRTQGIAISQQGTHIESEKTNLSNTEVQIEQEKTDLNTQQTTYSSSQNSYNNYDTESQTSTNTYKQKNYDYSDLDSKLARLHSIEETINKNRNQNNRYPESFSYKYKDNEKPFQSNNPDKENHGYTYEDIDWNVWKSNFINRILDDSMDITSLNSYKIGTWFYYSFIVTNTGEIRDVSVRSFTLKEEDKHQVRNMIYRYAHQNITVFPKNSKRKTAKVDAIMLLGESETKARPEDFNDTERIKVRY